ncbi:hypothetical protein AB0I53_45420 [Saccharopolyspora sp. NPDC050389]|uniref:hypothetical protein n=1 Tax=Saccharopolyspora sp. NPDC050389 TaxID=3155516 RepID=UPI0033E624B9
MFDQSAFQTFWMACFVLILISNIVQARRRKTRRSGHSSTFGSDIGSGSTSYGDTGSGSDFGGFSCGDSGGSSSSSSDSSSSC